MSTGARLPSKVIPGAQGSAGNAARSSTALYNFAYAYHQNAQYGPHGLLACVNSGGDGATILVYDMNSTQLVQTLTSGLGPSCYVTCIQWLQPSVSFMQHGVFLLSGNERGELLYWDVTAGVPLQRLVIPCRQPVQLLQLLSDERVLVVTNTATTYVFHTHLVDPTPLTARASDLPLRTSQPATPAPFGASPASTVITLANASRRALETSFKKPFSNMGNGTSNRTSPTTAVTGNNAASGSTFDTQAPSGSGATGYTSSFFPPQHLVTSKLASIPVCAVTLGDRVRLIMSFDDDLDDVRHEESAGAGTADRRAAGRPTARDVVYDTDDGEPTVMDVFFSEAQEEVLFFATRNSIGTYDWRLGTILNEQLVWMQDGGVEFRRIFPSSPSGAAAVATAATSGPTCAVEGETAPSLPLLYSFGSDQRLVAWYLIRTDKFATVAADVRGARINSKSVSQVLQSPSDPARFAIVFEDSTVADWRYCLRTRRWKQEGVCAFALSRPLYVCRMRPHKACYALDSGHMVLVDLLHSQTLRKFSVVYSGGTKLILACQDRWEELVWIVTHRMEDNRHHHQVSLLDTHSGEVVRVLRKPNDKADLVRMKEATMDPGQQYLLLTFWNGTFEVWNTSELRLLHIYTGLGVATAAWAPASMYRCLSGVQGQPQILAVLFSDGSLSFWSVYKDRVVVSRDAVPLFPSNAVAGGSPRGCAVGERLVLFDSSGSGVSLQFEGKLSAKRFRELPIQGSGPAVCIDSFVAACAADGCSNHSPPPAPTTASTAAAGTGAGGGDGMTARSPLADGGSRSRGSSSTEPPTGGGTAMNAGSTDLFMAAAPLVAVVFEDHTFGVWSVNTGDCVAYSRSTAAARLLEATQAFWLEGSLVVVSVDGTTYVMDHTLTRLNSSVRSKALRRPMQTMAFLLPSQRTSLQASLLLLNDEQAAAASTLSDVNRGNRLGASESDGEEDKAPASVLVTAVDGHRRPCRGPLGQVIDESVTTLAQELQLYRTSMVPPRVASYLAATASSASDGPARAMVVSDLFGYVERQRFWAQAVHEQAMQQRYKAGVSVALPLPTLGAATPYALADVLSPSLARAATSRGNHQRLCEQRTLALTRHRDRDVDDTKSRLVLARRLLWLSEFGKAVELLLDANYESPNFNELATLSVAIAAAAGAPRPSGTTASAALLSKAAHRSAALLLAQGDVDGAAEKYVLAGDFGEACTAFQSRGQWSSAALLAKWAPSQSRPTDSTAPSQLVQDVLRRWSKHCVRQRRVLPAARLVLSLGDIHDTLEVLRGNAPTADVAGLFALWVSDEVLLRPASQAEETPLDSHREDAAATDGESTESLRCLVLNALIDFADVLKSVGNDACEAEVLQRVARLKPSPLEL